MTNNTMITVSSISVKPRADFTPRPGATRAGRHLGSVETRSVDIPGADVGIVALAAGLLVGAEAEHVDLAMHAGI